MPLVRERSSQQRHPDAREHGGVVLQNARAHDGQ
jgi:hypothetical protein